MAEKTQNEGSFDHFQKEGKKLYNSSKNVTISKAQKKQHLKDALRYYYKAEELGKTPNEICASAKEIAKSHQRIAKVIFSERRSSDLASVKVHLKKAMEYYNKAINKGHECQSQEWMDKITNEIHSGLQGVLTVANSLENKEKTQFMEEFTGLILIDAFKSDWFSILAKLLFQEGVCALENEDFKACMKKMKDCNFPIEEAKRYTYEAELLDEMEVLQADVDTHFSIAEAMQAKHIGDELLKTLLLDEEEVNFDQVWEVIDWYKKAILLSRGNELEIECMALSNTGMVFDNVLKDKVRAKQCFMAAMLLSGALTPRTFTLKDWYMQCKVLLERYQQEAQRDDEKKTKKDHSARLEEIKEELEKLKQSDTDEISLLKYIYKNHPPKNKNHKLDLKDIDEEADMKKTLLKAIRHYHPDKQSEEKHGKKWVTLAEEITKFLTKRFETYKLGSSEDIARIDQALYGVIVFRFWTFIIECGIPKNLLKSLTVIVNYLLAQIIFWCHT